MRKATQFKFGRYIHSVHANKRPLKIWDKRGCWRIQRLPKSLKYSLLSQKRVKLRTSNLAEYIHSVHANKSPLKIWEKRVRGRTQGLPKFLQYPTRKATNFKFGQYIQRVHANKCPLHLEVKGAWAYPRSR